MRIITVAGVGLMGLVLVASLVRAGQKLASGSLSAAVAPSAAAASAVVEADGVQRISLSFGNFNYTPDTIRVKRGVPVEIVGDTSKLQGCFSTLAIPELNVFGQFTPEKNKIAFMPNRAGTFRFSCAMGMGAGKLVVES